ncbi:MAG: endonuclease/exonuclease/phosphatase family protein [Armatimonadota bacterium]
MRRTGRGPSRRREWLRFLTVLSTAGVVTVWAAGEFIGERHWLTTLLAYIPQHPFLFPAALLSVGSLALRRPGLAAVNTLVLVFGVFHLLGFSVGRHQTGARADLRVMTYNIHHGAMGVEGIASDIRQQQPDLVLLQEANAFRIWADPVPPLAKQLPDYRVYTIGDEVALLSRVPVSQVQSWRLRRNGARRKGLDATVKVGKRKLRILNVHLMTSATGSSLARSKGQTPAHLRHTAEVRSEQFEEISRWVERQRDPFIVAGDFNTPPRGVLYRRFRGWGLTDSFRAAGFGFGATYRSDLPVLRIDHIFTGPGVQVLRTWVPPTRSSDHRPVVADLTFEY